MEALVRVSLMLSLTIEIGQTFVLNHRSSLILMTFKTLLRYGSYKEFLPAWAKNGRSHPNIKGVTLQPKYTYTYFLYQSFACTSHGFYSFLVDYLSICPRENGFCVKADGSDQNSGVFKINDNDGNTESAQNECLNHCHGRSDATACEVIWNQSNRGCYIHTRSVARGNNANNHFCWVLSRCIRGKLESKYGHCYANHKQYKLEYDLLYNLQIS